MPTGATPLEDPNVKIPAAIKATAAKADALHAAAYQKDPPPAAPPADPKPQDPPPAEPPKAEDPPKAADPPPSEPPKSDQPQNFEHAYKSMKGRYDSAKETIRALNERITALENASAAPPAPAPAPAPDSTLTDQEVADYGKEFLDVVGKKAREAMGQEIVALKQQVTDLTNALKGVNKNVATNARERMKEELTEAVPDWQQINEKPEFLDWLGLSDPFSGAIRLNLLKEAWAANQSGRVLAFFKGFLAQEAALAPQERPQPDPNSGKVPLETFAAPGRAKSAADPASPAEKPIITASQTSRFYADVAAGKWRGREKEKDAFERQIILATREGRYDPRR